MIVTNNMGIKANKIFKLFGYTMENVDIFGEHFNAGTCPHFGVNLSFVYGCFKIANKISTIPDSHSPALGL